MKRDFDWDAFLGIMGFFGLYLLGVIAVGIVLGLIREVFFKTDKQFDKFFSTVVSIVLVLLFAAFCGGPILPSRLD